MTDPSPLYMHQLTFPLSDVFQFASHRDLLLPHMDADMGYILHCMLYELFSPDLAPSPFSVRENEGGTLRMLAYSRSGSEELSRKAQSYPGDFVQDRFLPLSLRTKQLPDRFPSGQGYRFELRTLPVVRKARGADRPGAELDVYLREVEKQDTDDNEEGKLDRMKIYRSWLNDRFECLSSVRLQNCDVKQFRLREMLRTDGAGDKRKITRPDVRYDGQLEVTRPEQVHEELFERGVGRHRAFGFGMVLLKRL